MYKLSNTIQPYAWGSTTAISQILGKKPSGGPEAELWMGAHPSAPSQVVIDSDSRLRSLSEVISDDPVDELGEDVAARFGGRLPFLLKILAAEKALSIQTHPTREQAEAGYAAENARGLAPKDPNRNYVDDWPKPEILCALTDFEALAGCRSAEDAAEILASLGVPALEPVVESLRAKPVPDSVAAAIGRVLDWPEDTRAALVANVVEACRRVASEPGPHAAAYDAVGRVSEDHPGDLGLVCTLLLKYVVLRPGEAIYLAAGGLHAYLHGTGIELLANSDNVLRAGLTPKHIDVPELLRIMDPAVEVPVLEGRELGFGVVTFDTPAPEFRLHHVQLVLDQASVTVPGHGPRIVLCISGDLLLHGADGDPELVLIHGESVFIPAVDGDVTMTGSASVFVASPGTL